VDFTPNDLKDSVIDKLGVLKACEPVATASGPSVVDTSDRSGLSNDSGCRVGDMSAAAQLDGVYGQFHLPVSRPIRMSEK